MSKTKEQVEKRNSYAEAYDRAMRIAGDSCGMDLQVAIGMALAEQLDTLKAENAELRRRVETLERDQATRPEHDTVEMMRKQHGLS